MPNPLVNPLDHTLAHLARLDLLVRREVLRLRLRQPDRGDDEFRGLYVSDDEVDELLAGTHHLATTLVGPAPTTPEWAALDAALDAATRRIDDLETLYQARGEETPLDHLSRLFDLSDFDRGVLVVCLAAEVDLKYERLYAYLQDDVTKKRPTVDLVLRFLCPSLDERLAARRRFDPSAPLMRWDLVTLHDDPGARRPVLLARYLKLDERIVGYLLGAEAMDARLASLVAMTPPVDKRVVAEPIQAQLRKWSAVWTQTWTGRSPVLLIHGDYGAGKTAAAHSLAAGLGKPLLLLNAADLLVSDLSLSQGLRLAEREALLTDALLGWAETDPLLHPEQGAEADHRAFVQALARGRAPTILLAHRAWEPARSLARRPFLRLEMPEPSYAERQWLWSASLNGQTAPLSLEDLTALTGRFRLTPGQIQDAVARAQTVAWARDPLHGQVTLADIDAACRSQAQHRLGTLARKLTPRYTWDDIVLPRPQLTTLHLISATVRQRPRVYGDWGFDRKLSMGKGLVALFAGPSGTGKTMAAEIIGNSLGLDVYKIDLSSVVSKYIGETEKNLERIFSEAQGTDAILFFDEADALFGKRSEVKDAHDRYANIEIAYLLQRTEEYNGLVILASNLKKNMDEAFIRRLHFTVDFPLPEEAERLEIWRRTFPPEAPTGDDLDLPFLARRLKISGGNIRNIILTAAFLAAEEQTAIYMRHLVRGASYELQKMGKLVVEGDFERYQALLHD